MKRSQSKSSNLLSEAAKSRLREGLLIILGAVSIYFLIALVTYHSGDPGWSSTGIHRVIANSGGRAGAWLADIFLYLFGYMAYLFPVMMATGAWLMFREQQLNQELDVWHNALRFIGFILTLLTSCGLAGLYLTHFHHHLPLSAGGILGDVVSKSSTNLLNQAGTTLIFIAFLLFGITIFTGLSWIRVIDLTGKSALFAMRWIRDQSIVLFDYLRDRIKARKALSSRKDKTKIVVTPPAKKVEELQTSKEKIRISVSKPPSIAKNKNVKPSSGPLPSYTLLETPQATKQLGYSTEHLENLSHEVERRLLDFGLEVSVVAIHPGPVITRFELELAPGIKVSKITALVKDLARALSVSRVRVVEVIPGKSVIGLEIPNVNRELVYLREVFESQRYADASAPLSLALGKDIAGHPVIVDLAKMPHLLVAGTTGSGKSVSINTMLLSLLFKVQPEEVRLIMVDPKMLELSVYEGIPHLLTPVVTDMKEAANAFRWCVSEMDNRYRLMASLGVRNLAGYNAKVKEAIKNGHPIPDPRIPKEVELSEPKTLDPLPQIVIVVDELADMMMVVGKKVEELIARIAQKARAAGIHMILATQRPSVDVITGLIKANIPTRIAFQVSSRIDSRTILDQQGAEQLLGCGDMLYLPPGTAHPIRVHGAFVSDEEVHRVVADLRLRGEPEYLEEVLQGAGGENGGQFSSEGEEGQGEMDPLYDQAVRIVTESRRASISYVQRRLKIGYNRSARILEDMENAGVVSSMGNNGAREVLAPPPPPED